MTARTRRRGRDQRGTPRPAPRAGARPGPAAGRGRGAGKADHCHGQDRDASCAWASSPPVARSRPRWREPGRRSSGSRGLFAALRRWSPDRLAAGLACCSRRPENCAARGGGTRCRLVPRRIGAARGHRPRWSASRLTPVQIAARCPLQRRENVLRYLVHRLLVMVPTLVAISMIVFIIIQLPRRLPHHHAGRAAVAGRGRAAPRSTICAGSTASTARCRSNISTGPGPPAGRSRLLVRV